MNALPLLNRIAALFFKYKFEAVMIGNAGAALHGAPVTTLDIDFMFRATPANLLKLKKIAKDLDAVIFRPYYPASQLFRLEGGPLNVQLDFMPIIHGVKSFAGLRSRAIEMKIGTQVLLIADLKDIIKSKKSANRPQDKVSLPILEKVLREKERK
jgi:hypothetical protein